MTTDAFVLPELTGPVPWINADRAPTRPDEFTFLLLADRTGGAREGVFERSIEVTNLLRPDFAIQIGDTIEGYTTDVDALSRQWAELEEIVAAIEVPLFRVAGNHDVSNAVMRAEWVRRYGALHYHFVYRDVLFLILDTNDPPISDDELFAPLRGIGLEEFKVEAAKRSAADPVAFVSWFESHYEWEGTMPANLGGAQIAWAEQVIADNPDVRWTVLCMHSPAWQGNGHPGLDRLRRALGDRPFTAFAGHVHNYRHVRLDGRDHIRLGATGGGWSVSGDDGNFDHVTLVTVTAGGPRIANLVLSGVHGLHGGRPG